jgi:hypothetical protein
MQKFQCREGQAVDGRLLQRRCFSSRLIVRQRVYTFLLIFTIAIAIYYPFSPGGRQARNLREAEQFIAENYATIHADPRFVDVDFSPMPAAGGCLDVGGSVGSQTDLEQLKRQVMNRHPPVYVMWHVWVLPVAQGQPVVVGQPTK